MVYTVYANIENRETSLVSQHRTLKASGKSYQSSHTGNLRRVVDGNGRDVTFEACCAVEGF